LWPDVVDIPIPSNDDAIRAIKLITSALADAVIEGKEGKVIEIETKEEEKVEELFLTNEDEIEEFMKEGFDKEMEEKKEEE